MHANVSNCYFLRSSTLSECGGGGGEIYRRGGGRHIIIFALFIDKLQIPVVKLWWQFLCGDIFLCVCTRVEKRKIFMDIMRFQKLILLCYVWIVISMIILRLLNILDTQLQVTCVTNCEYCQSFWLNRLSFLIWRVLFILRWEFLLMYDCT